MIASIRGTVAEIGLDRCVVETGGVGVLVGGALEPGGKVQGHGGPPDDGM